MNTEMNINDKRNAFKVLMKKYHPENKNLANL